LRGSADQKTHLWFTMASIASKNLYELLGNDPEQDPERATPQPPTKAVDKPVNRTGKRDAGPTAPSESTGSSRGRGGRGGSRETGSERAFRDRDAGSYNNRSRAPDDGLRQDRHPDRAPRGEYRGRGRGGRGGRGGRRGSAGQGDRQDKSGIADHPKQAAHGWGGETGEAEFADEKAGEAIAKAEEAEGFDTNPPPPENGEDAEPTEPEVKTKSYDDYLREQAEKKLALSDNVRKPNEGASKKFPEGKAFSRNEEEENYMAGSGGKAARFREKKEKVNVDMSDVDPRSFLAEDRQASRGGRGRGRGDRGGDRGDRSEGGGRGRGGFRGDRDGGRGSDRPRGEFRGRGGRGGAPPRADDNKAFPSLGGK